MFGFAILTVCGGGGETHFIEFCDGKYGDWLNRLNLVFLKFSGELSIGDLKYLVIGWDFTWVYLVLSNFLKDEVYGFIILSLLTGVLGKALFFLFDKKSGSFIFLLKSFLCVSWKLFCLFLFPNLSFFLWFDGLKVTSVTWEFMKFFFILVIEHWHVWTDYAVLILFLQYSSSLMG